MKYAIVTGGGTKSGTQNCLLPGCVPSDCQCYWPSGRNGRRHYIWPSAIARSLILPLSAALFWQRSNECEQVLYLLHI
jgi:hypothetical protein